MLCFAPAPVPTFPFSSLRLPHPLSYQISPPSSLPTSLSTLLQTSPLLLSTHRVEKLDFAEGRRAASHWVPTEFAGWSRLGQSDDLTALQAPNSPASHPPPHLIFLLINLLACCFSLYPSLGSFFSKPYRRPCEPSTGFVAADNCIHSSRLVVRPLRLGSLVVTPGGSSVVGERDWITHFDI